MRFAVIFQRSPVLPLILPLICWETPIRCYRGNSLENWGLPPLVFNEKLLSRPLSHKKSAVEIFSYWWRKKGVPCGKTRFPQRKKKKSCNVFCFKMEAIVHPIFRLANSVEKLENSRFIRKKTFGFIMFSRYLWRLRFFDNCIYFFLFF